MIKIEDKRNRLFAAALLAVMLLGIGARLGNMRVEKRTPDELFYTAYAQDMLRGGARNYNQVVDVYNSDEKFWVYPSPVRVGYVFLGAVIMRLTGSNSLRRLADLSCAASILSLGFLVFIGLEFFNQWATIAGLGLASVSPMDLAIARRAWQDSVSGLFGLLLVYVCCRISRSPQQKRWFVMFYLLGAACLLMKETSVIIYGLCVIWVLYIVFVEERAFRKGLLVLLFSLLSAIAAASFLAVICGGVNNMLSSIGHSAGSLANNTYTLIYNSGPWFKTIQAFFVLAPAAAVLFFIGIIGVFFLSEDVIKRKSVLGVVFFVVSFAVIFMVPHSLKNLRYFSCAYMLFYLIAGLGSYCAAALLKKVLKPRLVLAGVIAGIMIAGFFDYKRFEYLFVEKKVPSLAVNLLIEESR